MSPVTVKIRYYGMTTDIAGTREEELSLAGRSVRDLLAEVRRRHPELGPVLKSSRVAVGNELARDETEFRGGETVALLPPVAGG